MRQETIQRLGAASAKVGGYRGKPAEGYEAAQAELHLVKMEHRLEQMASAAPAPLTEQQRERLCNFLADLP